MQNDIPNHIYNMTNYIYKTKTDLEAASTLLTRVLNAVNENVQRYENSNNIPGQAFYELWFKRYSVYRECKDNLDFVIAVLKNYLDTHPEESSSEYTPRRITSIYDIGKYQTEALKAKRNIDTLLWMAKVRGDENKIKLYQECIEKLNYVYSNIAKNT